MDLELTPDQRELRDVARQALDAARPCSLARAFLEGRAVEPLHPLLTELGWYAVGVDPDDGFGIPGLALLAQQVRRPRRADRPRRHRGRARDCSRPSPRATRDGGARRARGRASDWSLRDIGTSLVAREDAGWRLDGHKLGVQHGASADAAAGRRRVRRHAGLRARAGRRARACRSARRRASTPRAPRRSSSCDDVTVADEDVLSGDRRPRRARGGVRRRRGRDRRRGPRCRLGRARPRHRVRGRAPPVRAADRQLPGPQARDGRRPRRPRVGLVLGALRLRRAG